MNIETLYLKETRTEKIEKVKKTLTKTFWKRQFQVETTTKQKVFDGLFGIVLPIVCFFFDPIIFRTNGFGVPLAGAYKPFAYILSFISIMSLLAFMLWGKKLKWLNGFLSGLFAAGAVVALIVGVSIFPFSVMGLVILIGALGFTPLLTAFVYWRNAVRAHKTALPDLGLNLSARMMLLSALFSVVVPAILNVRIQKGLETMQNGNATEIRQTAARLKYVAPLVNFSSLYLKYDTTGNVARSQENQALAESYKTLTGKEISNYNRRGFFAD